MNKADIVRHLYNSKKTKLTMIELDQLVEQLFQIIGEQVSNGREVQIEGFGTFAPTSDSIQTVAEFLPKPNTGKKS